MFIDTTALVGTDPNSGDVFWTTPQTWNIATSGSIVDNFASITNGTWSSGLLSTSVNGNNVQPTFTPQAIPEPGVIVLRHSRCSDLPAGTCATDESVYYLPE